MREEVAAALADPVRGMRLAALVDAVRPRRGVDPAARLGAFIRQLEEDPALAERFRGALREAFGGVRFVHLLAETGILEDRTLLTLLGSGVTEALLPPVPPDDDARALMTRVFRRRTDHRWVAAVPRETWARLASIALEGMDLGSTGDLALALRALAVRASASGIDEEVLRKLSFADGYEAPFLELPARVDTLLEEREQGAGRASYDEVVRTARACRAVVAGLRGSRHVAGTSLRLTRLTRRMQQSLGRMERLVALLVPPPKPGAGEKTRVDSVRAEAAAALLPELLEAVQAGRTFGRRVGQTIDLVAYEITEHAAAKGAKYLGASAKAYGKLFAAALGGGALVGVFAIFKLFLGKVSLPLAGKALVYGLNYAICFSLIYVLGATLATKQPAVTAATLAKGLDDAQSRQGALEGVADAVVVVWRSQFVSFLGNLLAAFPLAIGIAIGLERVFEVETVDVEGARELLFENHAFESPALAYAAIAGVFLFIAGLIQGGVDNRVAYGELETRMASHPRLRFLGRLRPKLAKATAKHAGGLVGNVVLGFLLGSTGVVGKIFGLPLDIRHIAFSSAHVGVAVLDAPELLTAKETAVVLVGVLGIGFVNFLVSFGLTLAVTLKSRRVTVPQFGRLARLLGKRLLTRPFEWLFPPRRAGKADDSTA
ncbi:MAG: hypothetical protein AAGH15_08745 [Myxococcota bacterium]